MSWLGGIGRIGGKLYRGEVSYDFVGRKRLWYAISGLILLVSIVALGVRGLNYSVEFKGGSIFKFSAPQATATQITNIVTQSGGGNDAIVQSLGGVAGNPTWQVQTSTLSAAQSLDVQRALTTDLHAFGMSSTFVGPLWGTEISHKALEALIAFLIVIVLYLSIAFEWKMAVAAFVALVHDIVITTGVYALTGFEVSPATVIGLLTILGYSLYDTVVVFDKVRENTAGLLGTGRSTYSQAANLALNQTLVRSINTSLIALLPVTSILVVGTAVLGSGELKDLSLVLFVGMLSGTYSSIFIATPVLCGLKERETQYKLLAKRVALRASGGRAAQRAQAKAAATAAAGASALPGGNGATAAEPPDDPDAVGAADASTLAADAAAEEGDETVPAGQPAGTGRGTRPPAGSTASGGSAAGGTPGGVARSGPRQQPRRTSAAKRRPAGKKKRR